MPQNKVGIGANILMPQNKGEGFVEISPNKTLFIQKLTYDDPIRPEIIENDDDKGINISTVEDVFNHFKPNCDVELNKEDGSSTRENFKFGKLADFSVKNLTEQSPFLKDLNVEYDAHLKIIKQLKQNKSLVNVIQNPDTKNAFISALRALAAELEDKK